LKEGGDPKAEGKTKKGTREENPMLGRGKTPSEEK
jgi:hypothetical protein